MRDNYKDCLAVTAKWEGGKVDHPRDPGGRTNRGVIQRVYDAYRRAQGKSTQSVYNMTESEYQQIYREQYWNPVWGDALPKGVDLSTLDYGVNSGPRQSVKDLQRVVKDKYQGKIDGLMGNLTLDAVMRSVGNTTSGAVAVIRGHCDRRMSLLRGLLIWSTFGRGWTNRVADVEANAIRMTGASAAVIEYEAEERDKEAGKAAAEAGGTVVGGGAAGGGTIAVGGDEWSWLLAAIIILVITGFAVWHFIIKRQGNEARAAALGKLAAGIRKGT